jgi:hypothetical protein
MKRRAILLFGILLALSVPVAIGVREQFLAERPEPLPFETRSVPTGAVRATLPETIGTAPQSSVERETEILPQKTAEASVLQDIPFLSQAPTGKWNESVFENGCEEASVLMAISWAEGKSFPDAAKEAALIRGMARDIEKAYGTSHDTSAFDLSHFLAAESDTLSVEFRADVTLADIRSALLDGYGMMVPVDGRALGNPHYTAPGPERHMLLAIGYESSTGEIITNDPGTKFGAQYRYQEEQFYQAIRDYATGNAQPIMETRKNIILLRKR